MLRLVVLGPLEVFRDERRLVVPSGKTSELLIRLALDAGRPVPAGRLIEDLWGPDAVRVRPNTLQSKVATLRRALGGVDLVSGGGHGYTLHVVEDQVDALVVRGCVSQAGLLLDAGELQAAVDVAGSALALLSSPDLLSAAGDGAWVSPHRVRLDEDRGELLQIRLGGRLQLGAPGAVIGDLQAAVEDYPFQESLWALLITALYRAGRQRDALAAYRDIRARLADELGLDPGPQLRQLEDRLLNHDSGLSAGAATEETRRTNLPSVTADLVGRDEDVAGVSALLDAHRLVTVVGPGGVGKTAVAIEVGHWARRAQRAAPDGVWLARLESAVTDDQVMDVLRAAMDGPPSASALLHRLRGMNALLILDNCEHVVEAASRLAEKLLDEAPGVLILCTSQTALQVPGEQVYELAPLGLDDAVELFLHRATPRPGRTPRRMDPQSVQRLCESIDGLPLAIELAAARTRTLSVDEITRRLDEPFQVLSDPASRKPPRQRSLAETIRWSYDLLFPDDQRGLWALSTFAGGSTLPAFRSVLEALDVPGTAAIDLVSRLASRSLLVVDETPSSLSDQASPVRYRLLESIRTFAFGAMAAGGLADDAQAAHARWYAHVADTNTAGVRGADQPLHLALARAERANIDAALAWSGAHDPPLALRIANGFGWAWVVLGDSRGAQRLVEALAAVGAAGDERDRATALLLASWIEASTGGLDTARAHLEEARTLAEHTGDEDLQARHLYHLAYVVSHDGDFAQALELTARSRALYERLARPWDQAANWLFEARAALSWGNQEHSAFAVESSQHWLERVPDPWLRVRGTAVTAELARLQGRFDDAVAVLRGAVATSRQLGFLQTEAYHTTLLGRVECQTGDGSAGVATLQLAAEKARAVGDVRLQALAQVHLGRAALVAGDRATARKALEASVDWHHRSGGGELALVGECLLASLDASEGVADAERRLVDIAAEARRVQDRNTEVLALDALARVAASRADWSAAGQLLDEADRGAAAVAPPVTDHERPDARRVRKVLQQGPGVDAATGMPPSHP